MKKVLEDRNNRIGGSDVTILCGLSKFKTPFELALEKAKLREVEHKPNIYSIFGEVMEKKITELMGNNEAEQFIVGAESGLKYVGNIDGTDKKEEKIIEIKTCKDKEKVIKEHEWQARFYLALAHKKDLKYESVQFQIYERTEEDNEKIKNIIEKYNLTWKGEFTNLDLSEEIAVRNDIKEAFENKKLLKKDISTKTIKRNETKEEDMLDKINGFSKFVEELKKDIFFSVEDKARCEEKEKELKQILGLEIELENEELILETNKIKEVFEAKKIFESDLKIKEYLSVLKQEEKIKEEIKKKEKQIDLEYGKFNNQNVQIHVQKTKTLDKDKYIEDLEEMLEKVGIVGYKEIEKKYKISKKIVIKEIQ